MSYTNYILKRDFDTLDALMDEIEDYIIERLGGIETSYKFAIDNLGDKHDVKTLSHNGDIMAVGFVSRGQEPGQEVIIFSNDGQMTRFEKGDFKSMKRLLDEVIETEELIKENNLL